MMHKFLISNISKIEVSRVLNMPTLEQQKIKVSLQNEPAIKVVRVV
jgi:hypothetical protein